MKRIAIIIEGDLTNPRGMLNASLNRIKYLKKIANYNIDVFCIQNYYGIFVRLLKGIKKRDLVSSVRIDDLNINILWSKFSIINYLLVYKLRTKPLIKSKLYSSKNKHLLKDYDLISAHSIDCGKLAMSIYEEFGVPYYVTWHGSDIHTIPFQTNENKTNTIKVLENAKNNFFVSNTLLELSHTLTIKAKKQLLYNGVSSSFYKYDDDNRKRLRERYNVSNKKVIAFVGNLIAIKNVLLLPQIIKNVANINSNIILWIIGDGKLRTTLQCKLVDCGVNFQIWGNQNINKMPDFMNVIDILVLPSKNEGLPLVTVEALACGANVVGSNVGGISEVIGQENSFDLNNDFVKNISNRIVEMLNNKIEQPLSTIFNWSKTAKIENEVYLKEINK